jgi:hypothetical protein
MSTQIAELKGKAGARDVELLLTQFFGGTKRGLCLQFTVVGRDYIQFDKAQVQGLVKELQNWLGEVELPFTLYDSHREQEKRRKLGFVEDY